MRATSRWHEVRPGQASANTFLALTSHEVFLSAIDLSHAALANEGGDVVMAEWGADFEGHSLPLPDSIGEKRALLRSS